MRACAGIASRRRYWTITSVANAWTGYALCLGLAAAEPSISSPPGDHVSSDSLSDEAAIEAQRSDPNPWHRRFPAARGTFELGAFSGLFFPHLEHELYDYTLSWERYDRIAGSLGVRAAYAPLAPLAFEAELAMMPATVAGDAGSALLYAFRGHALLRAPWWSVAPFLVSGVGLLGARSTRLGTDVDPAFHFGGGVAFAISRRFGARLDLRGSVSPGHATTGARIIYPEVLAGFTTTFRRPPRDSDGDGLYDPWERVEPADRCPFDAGAVRHRGCPDRDDDGLRDLDDRCPDEAGIDARGGCPALRDSDGDSFWDPDQVDIPPPGPDACPDSPGHPAYGGCPAPDSDGDGIVDPDDRCPEVAETANGYEDDDGCPDILPREVAALLGRIQGINFSFMSAEITSESLPVLLGNAEVLREYPQLFLEIQGHTDSDGDPKFNRELSLRRAEAVREFLVGAGIDATRVRAVGFGGERPSADNTTESGRAENRRIEIHLVDRKGNALEVEESGE